ncbi:hypothetical protein PG993_007744 [Apiospora rasikravindrae]|uniref:Uncharacterized protein n=1 Tax=Apiospora rasikravindrae TaxID=990691 RepID=A0ABR1T0L8_9PEZI
MHSRTLLLSLAPLAAMALPQQDMQDMDMEMDDPAALTPDPTASMYPMPSSIPAGDVLSGYYNDNIPPQVTGAVATSLASAIYSYEKELLTDTKYRSIANEVYMAAYSASATDFGVGDGFDLPFTTASWYQKGVPESDQKAIESYLHAYRAIETSVLGGKAAGATTTAAAPPAPAARRVPPRPPAPAALLRRPRMTRLRPLAQVALTVLLPRLVE